MLQETLQLIYDWLCKQLLKEEWSIYSKHIEQTITELKQSISTNLNLNPDTFEKTIESLIEQDCKDLLPAVEDYTKYKYTNNPDIWNTLKPLGINTKIELDQRIQDTTALTSIAKQTLVALNISVAFGMLITLKKISTRNLPNYPLSIILPKNPTISKAGIFLTLNKTNVVRTYFMSWVANLPQETLFTILQKMNPTLILNAPTSINTYLSIENLNTNISPIASMKDLTSELTQKLSMSNLSPNWFI